MEVKARIPGKVISLSVKEGDTVKTRALLAVMEAMKMEQPVASPVDGVVKKINVNVGDKVKSGDVLMSIE
ncbi:Biotin-requiring enzyme [Oscillibacter sp. PC13]|uniref:biotin/lipoyl-containing protein n=1 Tax=Oscillibacter sp. PC13 TaxID=1855299 RepID=UPI0008EEF392|nr:biotin/lipoyl-containing protein [Oscillibacter sp. PC13]SFP28838.1 Biotin-requiring enzyme [Oscillibacter sp. PC13]